MPEQHRVTGKIAEKQRAIIGANIRALCLRNGWSQVKAGELMGRQSASTVCAAEGHRNDRQRSFTTEEVEQLAAIFGVSPSQLMMPCANYGARPPTRFACLTCGPTPNGGNPAACALPHPARHTHAAAPG